MSHYETLQVAPTASYEEIRQKYKLLIVKFHPDKCGSNEKDAQGKFRSVQEAWEVLRDATSRKHYDEQQQSTKLLFSSFVNETVGYEELELDAAENNLQHRCRCGGVYALSIDEAQRLFQPASDRRSCVQIQCTGCSLIVQIE